MYHARKHARPRRKNNLTAAGSQKHLKQVARGAPARISTAVAQKWPKLIDLGPNKHELRHRAKRETGAPKGDK